MSEFCVLRLTFIFLIVNLPNAKLVNLQNTTFKMDDTFLASAETSIRMPIKMSVFKALNLINYI